MRDNQRKVLAKPSKEIELKVNSKKNVPAIGNGANATRPAPGSLSPERVKGAAAPSWRNKMEKASPCPSHVAGPKTTTAIIVTAA